MSRSSVLILMALLPLWVLSCSRYPAPLSASEAQRSPLDLTVTVSPIASQTPVQAAETVATVISTLTSTATDEPTATATPSPTFTPLPSPTDTPLPTSTVTNTPTITPTPIPACRAKSIKPYLREGPRAKSEDGGVLYDIVTDENGVQQHLEEGELVQILEETTPDDNNVTTWYHVLRVDGVTGWVDSWSCVLQNDTIAPTRISIPDENTPTSTPTPTPTLAPTSTPTPTPTRTPIPKPARIHVGLGAWDYGDVELRKARSITIYVQNRGDLPLILLYYTISGNRSDFSLGWRGNADSSDIEGARLRGGQMCYIFLVFGPTERGDRKATLRVWSNALNSTRSDTMTSIELKGKGIANKDRDDGVGMDTSPQRGPAYGPPGCHELRE